MTQIMNKLIARVVQLLIFAAVCGVVAAEDDALKQQRDQAVIKAEIAEAKAREAKAQVPDTKAEALAGKVNVDAFGTAALLLTVDVADDLAERLCKLAGTDPFVIHSAELATGIASARLLEHQLARAKDALDKAVPSVDQGHSAGIRNLGAIVAATGAVRVVGDLGAFLKSNVTARGAIFAEAKELVSTMLGSRCKYTSEEKAGVIGLGLGYLGELDGARADDLMKDLKYIDVKGRELQVLIEAKKKNLEDEKDTGEKRERLEAEIKSLERLVAEVDGLLNSVKPFDQVGPLLIAAKLLNYSKMTEKAKLVLDFNVKLDGIAVTRERFWDFLWGGERLFLSGAAILFYRFHKLDGSLVQAGAISYLSRSKELKIRETPDETLGRGIREWPRPSQ
jgi:hypothetical protein